MPADCPGSTSFLPDVGSTWQIDIDTTSGKVTWFDVNDSMNKALLSTISDFSNMYHVVMVIGSGTFALDVDPNFLETKYNVMQVSFQSNSVSVGITTRLIGEKITTTSVTSYQLTFGSFSGSICFGLIEIPDIDSATLDGGDFQTHWGPCADHSSGSMWPVGSIDWVCPCAPCDAKCTKCSGSSQDECETCSSGNYLQPASTSCLNTCPTGYWKDATNLVCASCHPACSACITQSNKCSPCNPGYYKAGAFCLPCFAACSACTGGNNGQCSACFPGYFLQPSPATSTCLDSCPVGYWGDTTINTCIECDAACSDCTGAANTQCSACNTGYFLQLSSTICLSFCLDGSWPNSTSNTCEKCDISCSICSSSDNTRCSSCKSGYFLQPSSTICLSTCPDHYYPNTSLNTCESTSNFPFFFNSTSSRLPN